jgi:hypothetical protein
VPQKKANLLDPSTRVYSTLSVGALKRVMVFNATFNNISFLSWWSFLLVEETGVPGETTDLPQVTDKLVHIML